MTRRAALALLSASPLATAQKSAPSTQSPSAPLVDPLDYVCPMDPDVRSTKPGVCSRCGMKLVLGIPDDVEYALDLQTKPRAPRPGEPVQLVFHISDPRTGKPVREFQIVHERLFHLFVVSQDLQYFVHDHPVLGPDGVFRFDTKLPNPGMYRVLGDFYPVGGTPQLVARTLLIPPASGGALPMAPAKLAPQLDPSHCSNLEVELSTEPPQPLAGFKTLLFFHLKPGDGIEKYLGAWGHMLAASDDLIDLIHEHPFIADGGPQMQFNLIFPRARTFRIWVQFQRQGVVNTAVFNLPVVELK